MLHGEARSGGRLGSAAACTFLHFRVRWPGFDTPSLLAVQGFSSRVQLCDAGARVRNRTTRSCPEPKRRAPQAAQPRPPVLLPSGDDLQRPHVLDIIIPFRWRLRAGKQGLLEPDKAPAGPHGSVRRRSQHAAPAHRQSFPIKSPCYAFSIGLSALGTQRFELTRRRRKCFVRSTFFTACIVGAWPSCTAYRTRTTPAA